MGNANLETRRTLASGVRDLVHRERPTRHPQRVQGRLPRPLLRCALLALLGGFVAGGRAEAQAVVRVAEDGALLPAELLAARAFTAGRLRERGVIVLEDGPLPGAEPAAPPARLGVERVFVIRVIGPLGGRRVVSLEELDPGSGALRFQASLAVVDVEELHYVMPRLADAVIERKAVGGTTRIGTVTAVEAQAPRMLWGKGGFTLGTPLNGFSLGWSYATRHWSAGVEVVGWGPQEGQSYLGTGVSWLPLDRNVSPYIGGSIGFHMPEQPEDEYHSDSAARLEAGVEVLRLHKRRVRLGVDLVLSRSGAFPMLHARIGF